MAHIQQQILDAVAAALVAAATRAADRVDPDRVDPFEADRLPAIIVDEHEDGEQSAPMLVNGYEQRTLAVRVRAALKLTAATAAEARAFGLEVEKAIAGSASLAALAPLGMHIVSSKLEEDGTADYLYAQRAQKWEFTYLVNPEAPDVAP